MPAIKGDGLIFETEAMASAMLLSGRPQLKLSLSIDTPDADIRVRLFAVTPDGQSILLGRDRIRARYRTSAAEARLSTPNRIEPYVFDGFPFTSRILGPGERLRLVIDTPASAHDSRNFNSGGVVAEETLADARRAIITLVSGGKDGSSLWLPIQPHPATSPSAD